MYFTGASFFQRIKVHDNVYYFYCY